MIGDPAELAIVWTGLCLAFSSEPLQTGRYFQAGRLIKDAGTGVGTLLIPLIKGGKEKRGVLPVFLWSVWTILACKSDFPDATRIPLVFAIRRNDGYLGG